MDPPRIILLVGLPRSATTWIGNVLASAPGIEYVHEPDNETVSFLGTWFKRRVPRFPFLNPGDEAPLYRRLWELAAGSPHAVWQSRSQMTRGVKFLLNPLRTPYIRAKERRMLRDFHPTCANPARPAMTLDRAAPRLIKTVHGVLCAEWITSVIPIDHVVVAMRHPLGVLGSWRRMRMPDAMREYTLSEPIQHRILGQVIPATDLLERQVLHLAVLMRGLLAQVDRRPDWIMVTHEQMCVDPAAGFSQLFERVGLPFTDSVQAGIASRNRTGSGFTPHRIAAAELGKWKADFTEDQMKRAAAILEKAGLAAWL